MNIGRKIERRSEERKRKRIHSLLCSEEKMTKGTDKK